MRVGILSADKKYPKIRVTTLLDPLQYNSNTLTINFEQISQLLTSNILIINFKLINY